MKVQEFLQEWEKENNPFYPNEMKWDRAKVNKFAKAFDDKYALKDPKLKYLVIFGDSLIDFNSEVDEIVEEGFLPLGSVSIVQEGNDTHFYQQFVKSL